MSKETIIVAQNEYNKARDIFAECKFADVDFEVYDEKKFAQKVIQTSSRAVILGVEKYTGLLYDALQKNAGDQKAIIARFGVGHDGVDKSICKSKNIIVTNTPGVLDQSVAEHAMWLMGSVLRKIPQLNMEMTKGNFAQQIGSELKDKKLAVIGFGPIGQQVAKAASFGFGMEVIAVDVIPEDQLADITGYDKPGCVSQFGIADYVTDARQALKQADIVSLHIPANQHTRDYMNNEKLKIMKNSAILINTARGLVVDECALFDALKNNEIAAAGLDVFENEPYVPVNKEKDLRKLTNVVLTPHIGSSTKEACDRMARACLNNIQNFFEANLSQLTTVG